jgi:hypothetical protein
VSSSSVVPAGTQGSLTIVGSSHTLVQINGVRVLLLVALPLVAVALVALSLWRRGVRGNPGAGVVAWTLTGVVGALSLLGILTIGMFILPIAVLFLVVCGRTR